MSCMIVSNLLIYRSISYKILFTIRIIVSVTGQFVVINYGYSMMMMMMMMLMMMMMMMMIMMVMVMMMVMMMIMMMMLMMMMIMMMIQRYNCTQATYRGQRKRSCW